jgi:hypothetical protein
VGAALAAVEAGQRASPPRRVAGSEPAWQITGPTPWYTTKAQPSTADLAASSAASTSPPDLRHG